MWSAPSLSLGHRPDEKLVNIIKENCLPEKGKSLVSGSVNGVIA